VTVFIPNVATLVAFRKERTKESCAKRWVIVLVQNMEVNGHENGTNQGKQLVGSAFV